MLQNADYIAFDKVGLADIFMTVGDNSLFMMCERLNVDACSILPDGYTFRQVRRDELEIWKRTIVDVQYVDYVTEYYDNIYAAKADEFFRRCIFVCDGNDKPVASCMLWRAYGQIETLGWLRVLPEYEKMGIGRALISEILKAAEIPVYLHTQLTSICAVKLYSDFGFALVTDPVIGYRKNYLQESLPYMQKILPKADYHNLRFVQADEALLKAALSSKTSEF